MLNSLNSIALKELEIIQWFIDLDLPFLNTEQTKELFQKDKETDYNV